MVNVFGESVGSGSSISEKVVTTVGQYEDYWAEINQSYVLGFPPYRVHTNVDGTFVTLIRYYGGYMYWTMLPRWILPNDILQVIKVNWYILLRLMVVVMLLCKDPQGV